MQRRSSGPGFAGLPKRVSLPGWQPSVPCGSARCTHDPYRPEREKLYRFESASDGVYCGAAPKKNGCFSGFPKHRRTSRKFPVLVQG